MHRSSLRSGGRSSSTTFWCRVLFIAFIFASAVVFLSRGALPHSGKKNEIHDAIDHVYLLGKPEAVHPLHGKSPSLDSAALKSLLDTESKAHSTVLDRLRKALIAGIKNGVHFFADYDVDKIVPAPTPDLSTKHPQYFFKYPDANSTKYPFRWLSNKPRVLFVPEFLTDEECDTIVNAAEKKMVRSQVALDNALKQKRASTTQDVRTSSGAWLDPNEPNSPAAPIVARALDFIGFPAGSSEQLQVLRYHPGQKYDAHLDYFDPRRYGPQTSNRAVTVYFYLSDVEEGGETSFPMADGRGLPPNYVDCDRGLRVRPLKRSVAIFYDMDPLGRFDPSSLHGGCPVKKGVKWGAPLWVRIPTQGADN